MSLCRCGREPLDSSRGLHVLGPSCRDKVERHVRRRFGAHRYGGRYAAEVPDLIQDCYQKLLMPGGLDSFRPAPGRVAADSFGAWLSIVVRNHCNNKLRYLLAQPAVGGDGVADLPEGRDAITPEQAFAREHIRALSERTVAQIEPSWRKKGRLSSERFDVLLGVIFEKEPDAARAYERLGITDGNGRTSTSRLVEKIRIEWRKQVLDDLRVEPGLDPEAVERLIDQEIEALIQAAYPGSTPWSFGSDSEAEPDGSDEDPEPKP